MRHAVVAVLAAAAVTLPAQAQDFEVPPARIPSLPAAVPSLENLIPAGWKLETKAISDLDGDGVSDVAMVVRGADPALVIGNEGLGPEKLDTNPRMLVVALGRPRAGYRVVVQNATLIPRHEIPTMDDPFDGVTGGGLRVAGRSIKVQLGLFMSAGGWGMANVTYTLRWQHGRLEMIGYDRNDTQRNTGEIRSVSINYSTGKVKLTTGNISDDREKIEWRTLPDRRLLSIDEIGDGLEFDAGYSG